MPHDTKTHGLSVLTSDTSMDIKARAWSKLDSATVDFADFLGKLFCLFVCSCCCSKLIVLALNVIFAAIKNSY